jgi:hypothetical protein
MDGSTTMSDIYVHITTLQRHHWAQAQAVAGGDAEFYNATSGVCQQSTGSRTYDAESKDFVPIYDENEDNWNVWDWETRSFSRTASPAHPYFDFDFELQVPHETPVDFASYYNNEENLLHFHLAVTYSQEVAKCIDPDMYKLVEAQDEEPAADDAAKTEEGLWDTYTPVGQPAMSWKWRRSMTLQATVPIIVVGDAPSVHTIMHYLTAAAPAPILRSGAQAEMPPSFPAAQPVFTVEALVNTTARLMQPGSTDPAQFMSQSWGRYPDPTEDYRGGEFAGVLWKKKIVAEERGIGPLRTGVVDGGDSQQPFSAQP